MATFALLCILFIVFLMLIPIAEPMQVSPGDRPHIKLYEGFYQKDMMLSLEPEPGKPFYIRKIYKINLKSVDIFIPTRNDGYDDARTVKLWSMYPDDITASSESDFYNSYTEPDFARRTNGAKYKQLLEVRAGQHVVVNITDPVKKVFIFARC